MKSCASSQSRGPEPNVSGSMRRPVPERRLRADRVNATQEAAHPFERRAVFELGRTAAAFRIDGEAESA